LWFFYLVSLTLKLILSLAAPARWLRAIIDVDAHPAQALCIVGGVVGSAVVTVLILIRTITA